jgi:hypothetical protein
LKKKHLNVKKSLMNFFRISVLDFWFCQILTQVNIFLEAKKTNAT